MSKIFLKVLTSRLRLVMESIISNPQGAFVIGRQILNRILIANECVDEVIKKGDTVILCKLDLEKAYDHINRNFLDYILGRLGFGQKWKGRMKACVRSVTFSVLINGVSKGFFKSSRGLRQGDTLSPFLFIVVMEAMSRMIRKAENGFLSGFVVRTEGLAISHLQYADDNMIFCGANIR